MPQNEPLISTNSQTTEETVISPAVAEVMERAHRGALLELERFTAAEINPFFYYLREANSTISAILGKETNPADLSKIISLKRRFRDKEAENDAHFKKMA